MEYEKSQRSIKQRAGRAALAHGAVAVEEQQRGDDSARDVEAGPLVRDGLPRDAFDRISNPTASKYKGRWRKVNRGLLVAVGSIVVILFVVMAHHSGHEHERGAIVLNDLSIGTKEGRTQLESPVEDKSSPSVDISKADNTDSDGGPAALNDLSIEAEEGRTQIESPVEDKSSPSVDISKANNTDTDGGGGSVLFSSCGVLITSQGGVGSSAFMKIVTKIVKKNPKALVINSPSDRDRFKHKPATYWKHHDRHAIVGTRRVKGGKKTENYRTKRVCFSKVLVIIGDPIHTIESTYRRFKLAHLKKLQTGSNLSKYPGGTTLTKIYRSIANSGNDEVGISNYISSWRRAQNDREHWPEVRLVTSKTLYNNAVDMAQWIGVKENELKPFKSLSYMESKHHEVAVGGIDEATMDKVKRVYDNITDIVSEVENDGA